MKEVIKEVKSLLRKAGDEILKIYGREYQFKEKSDKSPVTEADLVSERIILEGLKKYNYNILSEETKDDLSRLDKERIWIIDPLDGTQDFLQKTEEFSIMVGLIKNNKPVLGVVYLPVENKMYFAEIGKGAFLEQGNSFLRRLKVSEITNLNDSRFTVSRFHLDQLTKDFLKENNIRKVKYLGSTGIKLGLIAEGKIDGYITFTDKTCQWDICAPEIILKEAGGEITDLNGKRFIYNQREIRNLNGIVASNKKIHQQIIQKI